MSVVNDAGYQSITYELSLPAVDGSAGGMILVVASPSSSYSSSSSSSYSCCLAPNLYPNLGFFR